MTASYNHKEIESKWQGLWEARDSFHVTEDPRKKKYYLLEMFPYPSGKIHMGHVRNYAIGDVGARFKRMQGFNVLHPMGWDAFGLPAENAAIANKLHPARWTIDNIAAMKVQFKKMGFSYDWAREVATCLPEYYRWEQKIFIEMLKKGLAFQKHSEVNWCEACQTVLANEQVDAGRCWRCDAQVSLRPLRQWFFKITAYARELLEELDQLTGWPERVVTMQREWIGKSEGARIQFAIKGGPSTGSGRSDFIQVFTTRPDTLFGVTFLSLAAEHPLVQSLSAGGPQAGVVQKFVERVRKMDRTLRRSGDYEKEGVWTGAHAIHPITGQEIPIFAANFVLMEYGTGAVMAVPAHDQRDFEFAKKFGLPIKVVIQPAGKNPLQGDTMEMAFVEPGLLVQSGPFTGKRSEEAKQLIASHLADKALGGPTITYKLRDWGISRQRYWGAPIPVVHCETCGVVPVPTDQLPVLLPTDVTLTGEGGSPLGRVESFVNTKCPKCGHAALRETDTMDTFVESSWYFFRYTSPHDAQHPFDQTAARHWMPVDQYIGGIEHACMHLLYARFFTKVLRDLGYTEIGEPFTRLLTQGMVIKGGAKMSKSKGNVVDPDTIIANYGADTARLFSLFAAPPEKDLDWSEQGVEGAYRFLKRVWTLATADKVGRDSEDETRIRHKTIRKVTEDLSSFHFNTAIAALMEFYNFLSPLPDGPSPASLHALTLLLSPFVPHLCEELWEAAGGKGFIIDAPWPVFDPKAVADDEVTVVVQVNGKMRGKLVLAPDCAEADVTAAARQDPSVKTWLEGKKLQKTIFVPNRLINFVIS